ncbi:MAG: hypothetical protein IPP83_15875 [Flavobacteriales bacterium]|nr:hypothetical protein [Flavobacteriales bacterium]
MQSRSAQPELMIRPFTVMDNTLCHRLGLSPEEAIEVRAAVDAPQAHRRNLHQTLARGFLASRSMDRTDEFLAAIPSRFRYRDICLNESMRSLVKDGVSVTERTDQVLSVNASIEELREAYSRSHRRNIRSLGSVARSVAVTAAEFFRLFARTTGSRYGAKNPSDPVALRRAVEEDPSAIDVALCRSTMDRHSRSSVFRHVGRHRSIMLKSSQYTCRA